MTTINKPDGLTATKQEVREYCFQVWRYNNRDYSKTARHIKKDNVCTASRSTLMRWAKENEWANRADSLDYKEQNIEIREDEILEDLTTVHRKLMDAISNGQIDTATINTFVRNAKEITDICAKARKARQVEKAEKEDVEANNYVVTVRRA